MEDKDRTKKQLIKELIEIRKKIDNPESVEAVRKNRKDPLDKKMTLRESEIRYRKLFDNLKCGIAVYEATDNGNDFIFKDVNKALERIGKVKKKEIIGRSVKKVFPGVVEFGLFDVFKRVYNTGKPEKHPVTLYKDDRLIGWMENYVYKLPGGEVIAIYDDVSEYKQQEERSKHLNSILDTIRNVNQLIIKEKDRIKLIKSVCKTFAKGRGYYYSACIVLIDEKGKLIESAEYGAGKDFKTLIERIKKGKLTACWEKTMSSPGIIINKDPRTDCRGCPLAESHSGRGVMISRLKHGKKVYGMLSVSTSPGYIESKEEKRLFVEVAGDISFALHAIGQGEKREEAEIKLRESEHRFKKLSKAAREGIIFHDRGIILNANQAAADIIGVKLTDLIGKNSYDLMHSESRNKAKKMEREDFKETYELKFKNMDGKIIDSEIMGDSTYYDGRKVRVVVFRDITERKHAEEKLRDSHVRLKETLDDIMNTLASVVEVRDPYTAGHQRKVTMLAIAISKEMELDKDSIEAVNIAASIHDIGKISIPNSILSKPGKISDLESKMIKTHPKTGYDLVKGIKFPYPIARIVLQHHERLDGSGYPDGLKGGRILLGARILAVADVVEAMSSHRPYRSALGTEKALEEIKANRGKLYDAEIADACIELFNKKKFRFD